MSLYEDVVFFSKSVIYCLFPSVSFSVPCLHNIFAFLVESCPVKTVESRSRKSRKLCRCSILGQSDIIIVKQQTVWFSTGHLEKDVKAAADLSKKLKQLLSYKYYRESSLGS